MFGRLGPAGRAGMACALAATALGLFHLAAAGAPATYLVVNSAAFLLGAVALGGIAAAGPGRLAGLAVVAVGACLLATALLGPPVEGASRWIPVGPLNVQVSLVLLPFAILAFARNPGLSGTIGMALAALALALQPDRAMAGVLALSLAVLAAARRSRPTAAAALAAAAAFAAALARPDSLPAVPYVDRILFTAFDVHPLAGAAVLAGSLLLLVPAILVRSGADARLHLVFGAVWAGCILAAALGDYPTPVVGYGGSAILGYLLSLAGLPAGARSAAPAASDSRNEPPDRDPALPKTALAA